MSVASHSWGHASHAGRSPAGTDGKTPGLVCGGIKPSFPSWSAERTSPRMDADAASRIQRQPPFLAGDAPDVGFSGGKGPWLPGPDIMRGVGALMVVLLHTLLLIPQTLPIQVPGITWRVVYWGNLFLELFFAMSGFFIGAELLQSMPAPSRNILRGYFLRRWTRTLPAYYAILLVVAAYCLLRGEAWPVTWGHIFFFQHYTDHPSFLGAAWFLDVEQWSYLLLPVVVFCLPRFLPSRWPPVRRVALAALAIIALMLVMRCLSLLAQPQLFMDDGIRKPVHLRLDALMYGLLIACCKTARPRLYGRLQSGWCALLIILAALALVELQWHDRFIRNMPDELRRLFHAGLGFTLMGTLAALILPFLTNPFWAEAEKKYARPCAFFTAVSRRSYSLYLIHLPVLIEFSRLAHPLRHHPVAGTLAFLGCMLCAWGLCALLTMLSFALVEKPGMALRKKFPGSALIRSHFILRMKWFLTPDESPARREKRRE